MKGIDLTSKELGQFWQGVCFNSQTMDFQQFKLFCKLCSIKKANEQFVPESFMKEHPPIEFSKSPDSQRIGAAKLAELRQSAAPVQPQQSVYYGQPQMMGSQTPQQIPAYSPGSQMPSAYTPNPNTAYGAYGSVSGPQYGQLQMTPQPHHQQYGETAPGYTVLLQQSHVSTSPSQQPSDAVVVDGTDAGTMSAQDLISVRSYVESIQSNNGVYSFEALKSRVLGFGIETKEASRIWKLVDLQGTKQLNLESVICLFYLLAVRKKGVNVPPTLAEPLGKYIREKVPPHTDLRIADQAMRNVQATLSSSTVASSQDLMDRFKKAQQTSEDRLSQFKQANSQAFSQSDEQVVSA